MITFENTATTACKNSDCNLCSNTDRPHYKSLSGEIPLALFYWTFPMNQHPCFSPQTVVKEPWRITDHQRGSSITTSVKTPFMSTQRHYLVTLLAPIGLWSLLLKKHNDPFINLVSVSLTRSWTQAALHRLEHCPTVPNKLTLIAHSLTLHTDHHHFHRDISLLFL